MALHGIRSEEPEPCVWVTVFCRRYIVVMSAIKCSFTRTTSRRRRVVMVEHIVKCVGDYYVEDGGGYIFIQNAVGNGSTYFTAECG